MPRMHPTFAVGNSAYSSGVSSVNPSDMYINDPNFGVATTTASTPPHHPDGTASQLLTGASDLTLFQRIQVQRIQAEACATCYAHKKCHPKSAISPTPIDETGIAPACIDKSLENSPGFL